MSEDKQYKGLKKHSHESNDFARECLKTAMLQLSREKSLEDISVTALCARAGVSRMTFYRNYQVTNDIIQEIARDLNSDVVAVVGSPFRRTVTHEWYLKVFNYIMARREDMALMFTDEMLHQWMSIVNGLALHDPDFAPEKTYQRIMWIGGFENVVYHWLTAGMHESPAELADYCERYLPNTLSGSDV